jgi:hypothetical membrane protein
VRGVPRRGDVSPEELARDEVPWWGAVSAAAAPVLLLAGLTAASGLQSPEFDAFNNTVSALAGQQASYSWIMSFTFVIVAACDIATALALRPAARAGRIVLAAAGLAGMMVAAFPEHLGGSLIHACWAAAGFGGLIVWPALARRPGPRVPWSLRPVTCFVTTAVLSALTIWFAVEQARRGAQMGVAERAAGLAQTAWPVCVVMSCRRARPADLADRVHADDSVLGT